jgi:hypothetical protein
MKKIFKDLTTKKSQEIEEAKQYNIRLKVESSTTNGVETATVKVENPEQSIINDRIVENMLVEEFAKQLPEAEREVIQNSRTAYDNFKQDILDWAEENAILWIIKLKLSQRHMAISSLLDENPVYNTYRQKTVQEIIKKWVESGAIDKKILEIIKERDKKK